MSGPYFLDKAGDAALPEGAVEVDTEADFLRLALTDSPLLIRGRVTAWAEAFAEGRDITVLLVQSPASELQQLLPGIGSETAEQLLVQWPSLAQPHTRQSLATLGTALADELQLGTAEHAAHWLLQRINSAPEKRSLLESLGPALTESVWEEWRPVYLAPPDKAADLLFSWIGLGGMSRDWPAPFPATLTGEAEQRVKDFIAHAVAAQGLTAFERWQADGAAVQVLRLGAVATAQWLREHPEQLTPAALQRLRDYLPTKTSQDLAARLPVRLPAPPPADPAAWSEWMAREYLPYRTSQNPDLLALSPILRSFAEQFLLSYSAALNIGIHAEHLVWQRTAALRHSQTLTLVVIADGLSLYDLTTLQGHLAQQDTDQRLSDCGVQVAFPALPTITHQAKPALVGGVAPILSSDAQPLGPSHTQETKVEAALREGKQGDIVFWNYVRTDKLYHDAGTLSQARTEANATLLGLAERILGLMLNAIPKNMPAQLVITSDHGRLLLPARRTTPPPAGFKPEGRAASGEWQDIPASGFELREEYALLGRTRFGLNEDAAVMWGNEMFMMSNGATGGEICPHGGITPEEVLIPWAVYARDLSFRLPTFEVTGQGMAEEVGKLRIRAINANALPLTVSAAAGMLAERLPLSLPWTLPANDVTELEVPLSSWPKKSELAALQLRLSVRAGEAAAQNVSAQVHLESEELYSSTDDILDGLL
ncbi:hypothetical protein [Deinococcus humi]|uniref:PglZ domain-containing protein n=1 Tax=Deinococcus humi TaxID=662880 RepID=A0A7W8K184_9DEIO|nr:hypothetical protein [Deinococcus humi]MBB5365718.1 hypothetical protein [Deinococcus humi]GGO38473.1 hypothetical protein GCM10008949_45080 [Deinococcus humi]